MAKNKSRSNKTASQAKPKNAAPNGEASKAAASRAQTKQKEVLYQIKTCHWLPDNFRDAMKQRRAQRAVSSGNMIKK